MPATARANVDVRLSDESVEDHGSYLIVRGVASTFNRDRVGDTVTRAALERAVERYLRNPIMLYGHSYDRPAGLVTRAEVRDDGLHIEAKLPKPADPENLTRWALVRDKVMRGLSIGGAWTRDAMKRLVEIDLREISIAAVPVNADTLLGAQLGKAFGDAPDAADVAAGLREVAWAASVESARIAVARLDLATR